MTSGYTSVWDDIPEPDPDPKGDSEEVESSKPHLQFVNWEDAFREGLVPPQPRVLARRDEKNLFYPGKIHSLIGEPESLKSWLLLLAVVQQVKTDNSVLFLDYEDGYTSVGTRLRLLGLSEEEMHKRFLYVRVDDKFNLADGRLLEKITEERAETSPVTLCCIDGVTEAMSIENFRTNDDDGVAAFYRLLPRFVAALGLATVMVDHVVKSREGRGVDARGSGQKRAGIDGSSFVIDKRQEFAPGKHGVAYIKIAKDRPGGVRAFCDGSLAGIFHIVSTPATGSIDAWIDVPTALPDTVHHNGELLTASQIRAVLANIKTMPGCNKSYATEGVEGLTHKPAQVAIVDYILSEKYASDSGAGGPRSAKKLTFVRDYSFEVDGLDDI